MYESFLSSVSLLKHLNVSTSSFTFTRYKSWMKSLWSLLVQLSTIKSVYLIVGWFPGFQIYLLAWSLHNLLIFMSICPHFPQTYDRENIADALVSKSYSQGEAVVRQGDEADGMYFVEVLIVSTNFITSPVCYNFDSKLFHLNNVYSSSPMYVWVYCTFWGGYTACSQEIGRGGWRKDSEWGEKKKTFSNAQPTWELSYFGSTTWTTTAAANIE